MQPTRFAARCERLMPTLGLKQMTGQVADYTPWLREAIAGAKSAGLEREAAELESRVFAAYTTSSELLGETGDAIEEFLHRVGRSAPPTVTEKLRACLSEIGKVWPKYVP